MFQYPFILKKKNASSYFLFMKYDEVSFKQSTKLLDMF